MIRIGIVDDHSVVRAGLRQFLADEVDFRVTAEAGNGREALDIVRGGEVDVAGFERRGYVLLDRFEQEVFVLRRGRE